MDNIKQQLADILMDTLPDEHPWAGRVCDLVDALIANNVTVQEEGYWINIPPYRAINGDYNKAQKCPKCHAFFVSNGNEPYSNHPYCCECGARLYPQPPKGE